MREERAFGSHPTHTHTAQTRTRTPTPTPLPVWLRGNLDEAVTDPQTDKQGKQRSPRDPST